MSKSPDAFRTISEVADWLGVQTHVLRFWESRFPQIKPMKRAGGRRYYRPADMALLGGIRRLLHDDGMTIRGVQKILRDRGVRYVASLSPLDIEGVAADADAAPAWEPTPAAEIVPIRRRPAEAASPQRMPPVPMSDPADDATVGPNYPYAAVLRWLAEAPAGPGLTEAARRLSALRRRMNKHTAAAE